MRRRGGLDEGGERTPWRVTASEMGTSNSEKAENILILQCKLNFGQRWDGRAFMR